MINRKPHKCLLILSLSDLTRNTSDWLGKPRHSYACLWSRLINWLSEDTNMVFSIYFHRFEMPYNIWCGGCNSHIGMGVRYNAEKTKTGMYYSTPIYKFRMKCHLCPNYFEIQTDPKVSVYKPLKKLLVCCYIDSLGISSNQCKLTGNTSE